MKGLIRMWFIINVSTCLAVDYSKMYLTAVPENLDQHIVILRLSKNNIYHLNSSSFERYSNLKELYIDYNPTTIIEMDCFIKLTQLQILDLTHNLYFTFPFAKAIPFPTELQDLRISLHMNMNLAYLEKLKKLSLTKIPLEDMPDMGVLETVIDLDLSNNVISNISFRSLQQFCKLQRVSLPRNVKFIKPCVCWQFAKWAGERKIETVNFHQSICEEEKNCYVPTWNAYDKKCELKKSSDTAINWIITIGGFSVIFLLILIMWCIHISRRGKARIAKRLHKQETYASAATLPEQPEPT